MKNLKDFGYSNYCVTYDGRIYSLISNKFLKVSLLSGYERVSLYKTDTKEKISEFVHRLVAKMYCIGYSEELEVNHKDGDKRNNCATNLEWVTRSTNLIHAHTTGLKEIRKLDNNLVISICKYLQDGYRVKDVCDILGVDRYFVNKIKAGATYTEISEDFNLNVLTRNSKISINKVIEICKLLEDGVSRDTIAKQVGVGSGTVGRIKRREYYTTISNNYSW